MDSPKRGENKDRRNNSKEVFHKYGENLLKALYEKNKVAKIHVSNTVARCLPSGRKVCDIERVMAIIARKPAAMVK